MDTPFLRIKRYSLRFAPAAPRCRIQDEVRAGPSVVVVARLPSALIPAPR